MSSLIEALAEMEGEAETVEKSVNSPRDKKEDLKNEIFGEGAGFENEISGKMPSQEAKADLGKLDLTLVPTDIIRAIAVIRMHGTNKYGSPDNWKKVDKERYKAAFYRHWLAYLDNPKAMDPDSGYPNLWHAACNIAFLIEMEGYPIPDRIER